SYAPLSAGSATFSALPRLIIATAVCFVNQTAARATEFSRSADAEAAPLPPISAGRVRLQPNSTGRDQAARNQRRRESLRALTLTFSERPADLLAGVGTVSGRPFSHSGVP